MLYYALIFLLVALVAAPSALDLSRLQRQASPRFCSSFSWFSSY